MLLHCAETLKAHERRRYRLGWQSSGKQWTWQHSGSEALWLQGGLKGACDNRASQVHVRVCCFDHKPSDNDTTVY